MAFSWLDKSPFGLQSKNGQSKTEPYAGLGNLLQIKDALYEPYVSSVHPVDGLLPAAVNQGESENRKVVDMAYPESVYALYDTVDYSTLPDNPLAGLVKSSADLSAESALKLISKMGEADSDMATSLLGVSYSSQIEALLKDSKNSVISSIVEESLSKARAKADRFISPSSRVSSTKGKAYIDWGVGELTKLFSPLASSKNLSEDDKNFVSALQSASLSSKDSNWTQQFNKFYELFNPASSNYIGSILNNPNDVSDQKLSLIWGRWDYMRQVLGVNFRNKLKRGSLNEAQYERLITSLEQVGKQINYAISGYIASRAHVLKREAFIVSEVRSSVAMKLLEQKVNQAKEAKRSAIDETKAYSHLLSQLDCLQSFGYGPNTFTPDGDTVQRTHAEMGIR